MSDDLKDNFDSDDEYDEFNDLFNQYKNNTGQFGNSNHITKRLEIISIYLFEELYLKNNKYVIIPLHVIGFNNFPICIFKLENSDIINYCILN